MGNEVDLDELVVAAERIAYLWEAAQDTQGCLTTEQSLELEQYEALALAALPKLISAARERDELLIEREKLRSLLRQAVATMPSSTGLSCEILEAVFPLLRKDKL